MSRFKNSLIVLKEKEKKMSEILKNWEASVELIITLYDDFTTEEQQMEYKSDQKKAKENYAVILDELRTEIKELESLK